MCRARKMRPRHPLEKGGKPGSAARQCGMAPEKDMPVQRTFRDFQGLKGRIYPHASQNDAGPWERRHASAAWPLKKICPYKGLSGTFRDSKDGFIPTPAKMTPAPGSAVTPVRLMAPEKDMPNKGLSGTFRDSKDGFIPTPAKMTPAPGSAGVPARKGRGISLAPLSTKTSAAKMTIGLNSCRRGRPPCLPCPYNRTPSVLSPQSSALSLSPQHSALSTQSSALSPQWIFTIKTMALKKALDRRITFH